MTREEFVQGYCERSQLSLQSFRQRFVALACACEASNCPGWAVVQNEQQAIDRHNELYAPIEVVLQ